VFKAHRLLYHSTLGLRVMKKKFLITSCTNSSCVVQLDVLTSPLLEGRVTGVYIPSA